MTSLKAKLALVAFLVAGVVGVVVWDRKNAAATRAGSMAKNNAAAPGGSFDGGSAVPGAADFPATSAPPPSFGEPDYPPPAPTPASSTGSAPSADTMTVDVGGPAEHPTGETVPPTGGGWDTPASGGLTAQAPPDDSGWQQAPAPAPQIPELVPAPIPAQTYTVKPGDCLETIAQAVYGKGKYWRKILEANKAALEDEETVLKVGMVLKVPALDIAPALAPAPGSSAEITPAPPGMRTYQIQPGDSYEAIATKLYGTTRAVQVLINANKDRAPNPNRLKIGQTILVPEYSAEPAVHESTTPESEPAAAGTGERVYTVKADDRLWTLAEEFYSDGNQWTRIFEANKARLKSPDRLREGMKLVIPPAESGAVR